jgi:predicted RNA-binding Zn-ribbon protein involved in translation (DUF1610 family)
MDPVGNEQIDVPEEARCLGCGYRLRGLAAPMCPECGRAFDPGDLTTFDHDPRVRRRRRWATRIAVWGTVIVLVAVFAPRGIMKSSMVFTCANCGQKITSTRWEARPPSWFPGQYLGLSWTTRTEPSPAKTVVPRQEHVYAVNVSAQMRWGWCSGSISPREGSCPTVNGWKATPETASDILRRMMSPTNRAMELSAE